MSQAKCRIDQMTRKLKERDFRLTPQRLAIVKFLASSKEHPTVEEIYERIRRQFSTTSLATIYKTVTLLKSMGEVLALGFGDERKRYDGNNPSPHPHLTCVNCRKIIDLENGVLTELSAELGKKTGYRIVNLRVDFYGVCPSCQEHQETAV